MEEQTEEKPVEQVEEKTAEQTEEKTAEQTEEKPAEQTEQTADDIQTASEEKAAEQAAEEKPAVQVPLAPRCENPIIGRKIFFVNPPIYVENYLQPELKQHDYEAYIIKDYKYTKNALRRFPDGERFILL